MPAGVKTILSIWSHGGPSRVGMSVVVFSIFGLQLKQNHMHSALAIASYSEALDAVMFLAVFTL